MKVNLLKKGAVRVDSPAKAGESAPRAPRGGWWRRRHT